MKVRGHFATLIAEGALPNAAKLNQKLLTEILSFSKQDRLGHQWSKDNYQGGYSSYGSLSDMHHRSPGFMHFEEVLTPLVKRFALLQGWSLRGVDLNMTSCWMNIMPKGTYHSLHMHPLSVISGVYYVSTPPKSVSLKIEDPRMGFYMNAPLRSGKGYGPNPHYHKVSPRAGNFVLFESWVRHEVPPNQSTKPRISISFNYSLEPKS